MAKVHLLAIPDATFAQILTLPELDYLNYLTGLYFWEHIAGNKITLRSGKMEKLIRLLNLNKLDYSYATIEFTEDKTITTLSFSEPEEIELPI